MTDHDMVSRAEKTVRAAFPGAAPDVALLLGSGWGPAVEGLAVRNRLPYSDIPGLGAPQVKGHDGELLWARHADTELIVFVGRRHFYEGAGWTPVALPVHLSRTLGATRLVVTNASGGIRANLAPGDLVLIEDHINLMGSSPLIGPHHSDWGPRFPDMSCPYDPTLRRALEEAARQLGETITRGTYAAVHGPAYETRAEIRALECLGADLVGMSTVPEVLLAHAAGLRVLGLSLVTNIAGPRAHDNRLKHDDVVAAGRAATPRLRRLIEGFLEQIAMQQLRCGHRGHAVSRYEQDCGNECINGSNNQEDLSP